MKVHAIFGPPGTGKTRRLVELAKEAAQQGSGVLYLSFTRAAAQEAVSRLPPLGVIRAGTIHSLAFNTLGMSRAAVVDRVKLTAFGKTAGFPFQGTEHGSDEPQEGDEYATVVAFANNRQIEPWAAYERFGYPGTRHRFALFLSAYADWKRTFGYMDFDDMLMRLIESNKFLTPSYSTVFLDEAQDCSPLQWRALEIICKDVEQVYVAGDDDQAIYEWNGADPHGMAEFIKRHKGTQEVLRQSHRVPKLIHELAHAHFIRKISKRVIKKFDPRPADGAVVRYGDFTDIDLAAFDKGGGGLVLCRDNWRLKEIQREFNRMLIPYNVLGGGSPWTSKIAQALKKGEKPEVPPMWRDFYAQADLTRPVQVNISTIHQAKGREADSVIVDLSLSTRVLNNYYSDPDAEARVQYVAVTRAACELIICSENPLL